MCSLEVSKVSKQKGGQWVLRDIDLQQQPLQKIAIAGETGSGKTSLLKIIAGLEQATEGNVFLNGERIIGPEEKLLPGHPRIGYLSQHFELRNNYKVKEILEMAATISDEAAAKIYDICNIDHLLDRKTTDISGGEKQRIALARILVTDPQLLLLDEPFSDQDMIHRSSMKQVLSDIIDHLQIDCMMVSHDPSDILPWASEVIIMKQGRIVEKADPFIVYHSADPYTAALFGMYNELNDELQQLLGIERKILRPEMLLITDDAYGLEATIQQEHFYGDHYLYTVGLNGHRLEVRSNDRYTVGDRIRIRLRSFEDHCS